MKLTACLCRKNHIWIFKTMWKDHASRKKEGFFQKPLFLEKGGVQTLKSEHLFKKNEKVFPEWKPVVPDDVQFKPLPTLQDDPNYRENAVYEFSTESQLADGENQALVLTKSQPFIGLPHSVKKLMGKVEIPDQDILIQRTIMQANKWDPTKEKLPRRYNPELPIWKFKAEFGIPNFKIATLTMQNILKSCNLLIGKYPNLLNTRRSTSNVQLSTYYYFEDKKHVSIKGNTDAVVYSSLPIEPFLGKDAIERSVSHVLPDIYPLAPTLDLTKQHVWKEENIIGYRDGYKFQHPHTLFLCHDDEWNTSQHNAKALMFSFGYAVGLAKNLYGENVKLLPKPISTQCVLTNGISFNFACFQLNCLDFSSPVKNFVWFDSDNVLFNKVIPKRSMLRHTKYQDYDPEVIKKVLALYANGTDLSSIFQ